MKQLLICNSNNGFISANEGEPMESIDLSNANPGDLVLGSFANHGLTSIYLGQVRKNSTPFIISEIDLKSLDIHIAESQTSANYTGAVTIPTPEDGDTFTLILVKKGAVPHERNTWTATETIFDATKQTATKVAEKLANYFKAFADSGSLPVEVSVSGAAITITGLKGDWTLKCGDDLYGTEVTETPRVRAIDKAYIEDLASQCAAGKGFTDTYQNGDSIYPGYPEEVEDTTYVLYTLRFAVPRLSAKTRDEVVSQLVHIAIPTSNSDLRDSVDEALSTYGYNEPNVVPASESEQEP